LTSAERSVNTIVVYYANIVDVFVPPIIIFKRMHMDSFLVSLVSPLAGSLVEISD